MEDYYTNPSDYQGMSDSAPMQSPMHHPMQHPMQHPMHNAMQHMQHKYSNDTYSTDWKEILKRVVKYLIEGIAVAFVAYFFIGKNKLNIKDVLMLGITAAFVFAILDVFSPTVALGTRFGAGFGIGQGLFGVGPAALIAPMI